MSRQNQTKYTWKRITNNYNFFFFLFDSLSNWGAFLIVYITFSFMNQYYHFVSVWRSCYCNQIFYSFWPKSRSFANYEMSWLRRLKPNTKNTQDLKLITGFLHDQFIFLIFLNENFPMCLNVKFCCPWAWEKN